MKLKKVIEELNLFDTDGDKDSDIHPDFFNQKDSQNSFRVFHTAIWK